MEKYEETVKNERTKATLKSASAIQLEELNKGIGDPEKGASAIHRVAKLKS